MLNSSAANTVLMHVWQVAIAVAIAWSLVRLFARDRPYFAFGIWLIVAIKCVTPPIWGHPLAISNQLPMPWLLPETRPATVAISPGDQIIGDDASIEWQVNSANLATLQADLESGATAYSVPPPAAVPTPLPFWLTAAFFLIAMGSVVSFSIVTLRFRRCLAAIRKHRIDDFDSDVQSILKSIAAQLRITRLPNVIVSAVLFGPAVLGIFRPTIVLPRCLIYEREDSDSSCSHIKLILAHELMHIRRGDLWVGALQAFIHSLWWFHPCVWLMNRALSREAERCCDESVISELGCSPADYARSLLSVIEAKQSLQAVPVFPGMKPVEITSQRMERIMSLKNNKPRWSYLAVAGLLLFAALALPGVASRQEGESTSADGNPHAVAPSREGTATSIQPAVVVPTTTGRDSLAEPVWRDEVDVKTSDTVSSDAGVTGIVLNPPVATTKLSESSPPYTLEVYALRDIVDLLMTSHGEGKTRADELSELLRGIREGVATESWDSNGGDGRIVANEDTESAVVRQTQEVHEQLVTFLTAMRDRLSKERLVTQVYAVADLIVPLNPMARSSDRIHSVSSPLNEGDPAFAPLIQLLKASVAPESWDDRRRIRRNVNTLSLVIRQTNQAHDEISKILSQLRRELDWQITLDCVAIHFESGDQVRWLKDYVSFQEDDSIRPWCLLPACHFEQLQADMQPFGATVLFHPKMTVFDRQQATISGGDTSKVEIQLQPNLYANNSLIRLQHSATVGADVESAPSKMSSLLKDGQTLLVDITENQPLMGTATTANTVSGNAPMVQLTGRVVLAITARVLHIEQEEVTPAPRM